MQNPYFRALLVNGDKIDINLNAVAFFTPTPQGTNVTFNSGSTLTVQETPAKIRGVTRRAWPSDIVEEAAPEAA